MQYQSLITAGVLLTLLGSSVTTAMKTTNFDDMECLAKCIKALEQYAQDGPDIACTDGSTYKELYEACTVCTQQGGEAPPDQCVSAH